MTVTTTAKGRYKIYVSDASTVANIVVDLVTSLGADGIASERVIYFNTTDKTAIAEVGR